MLVAISYTTMIAQNIYGFQLPLSVERVKTTPSAGPIKRTPVCPPAVGMDGYTLYFETGHPAFTLVLIDEDGEEAYTVVVPTAVEEIALPSTLAGDYELQLYDGSNFYFYCDIIL